MSELRTTLSPGAQKPRSGSSHLRLLQVDAQPARIAAETMERCLCEVCGDVIGVYEPFVIRSGHEERTTSRAAEPELSVGDGVCCHRECHADAVV
jgi:hypothetical protein